MHNTGNPLGSKDILDLYDNSENIDYFANSQLDEHPDRFGTKRLTLAGLIKRSMALRNEINDFSGALTFKPEWSEVPMNVSEGVGGEGGALNLQAEALGNRTEHLARNQIPRVGTVTELKTLNGKPGDLVILISYNDGWGSENEAPKGGGELFWISDPEFVGDDVLNFKCGSGGWRRKENTHITLYNAGCRGNKTDDTVAIKRAFKLAGEKFLDVYIGKGNFQYTETPEITGSTSIIGEYHSSNLFPIGCDGLKYTTSDYPGSRVCKGVVLYGGGGNDTEHTAIIVDPGKNISKRTTGVSFEDILIINFKTAGDFKNLWHSTFRSVNATNVCNGLIFRGRCVANEIGSGVRLVRGNAISASDCIGISTLESNDYTPAEHVRPEDIQIGPALVFGFDVGIDIDSMLTGGIHLTDIDFCRKVGIRYRLWDNRGYIAPCWIAGDANFPEQPFIGIQSLPRATQNPSGPVIKDLFMGVFNNNPGDVGIKLGSQNGRAIIENVTISMSKGTGIYDNGAKFNIIKQSTIVAETALFLYSSGGNTISDNTFYGTIVNRDATSNNTWGHNNGETFTGGVLKVSMGIQGIVGTIDLSTCGFTKGLLVTTDSISITPSYIGTSNPGSMYSEIDGGRKIITLRKETPFNLISDYTIKVDIG